MQFNMVTEASLCTSTITECESFTVMMVIPVPDAAHIRFHEVAVSYGGHYLHVTPQQLPITHAWPPSLTSYRSILGGNHRAFTQVSFFILSRETEESQAVNAHEALVLFS